MQRSANHGRGLRGAAQKGRVLIERDAEEDAHTPRRELRCMWVHGCAIRKLPSTNASIWVRWKQSRASAGRQTIGSLSLKEVFSTTGTPVCFSNSLISAW